MNEVEQFLQDTAVDPNKVDVLDQPLVAEDPAKGEGEGKGGEGTGKKEDEGEEGEAKPRNRRERRLMTRLEQEKQSSAFLAGKLEARTEASKAVSEEADYLKAAERIYGTDSPEAQLATDLLKKAITGARDDAETRAYERIKAERQDEIKEQQVADQELDTMLDEIEEEYGVSLTEAQERSFFQLLEKMSPKDRDGKVSQYADANAVWEVFSEKLTKAKTSDTRAKDMSSRSMTQSGASKESNLQDDVAARFLKEQGII